MAAQGFEDRVAVVTGGASGIGSALAAELARRGAHVVLADLDRAGVKRVAEGIDKPGRRVGWAEVDVREADAVQALVDQVVGEHGRIDLLFNNAGIVIGGETHTFGASYWSRVIEVNLIGVANGIAAAYPVMVAQGHGHIVNTASAAGLAPAVFVAAYTASKHGVVGLSAALRPEAAARGVRVTCLCPGAIDTPILDRDAPPDLPPHHGRHISGRAYMGLVGMPLMAPERFARLALDGVERNRAIVVPGRAKAVWWINRLSPRLTQSIGSVVARRVVKEMDAAAQLANPDRAISG